MSYELIPGRTRALCCECGTVRTCTTNLARLRGFESECHHTPDEIAALKVRDTARKGADYAERTWGKYRPYERMLCDLKCATCGVLTRHALLNDHDRWGLRDKAELEDHGWERRWYGGPDGAYRWVRVRRMAPRLGEV